MVVNITNTQSFKTRLIKIVKSGARIRLWVPKQTNNTPKPKCVSKPASTPIYLHTSAVGGPVGGHYPTGWERSSERGIRIGNF